MVLLFTLMLCWFVGCQKEEKAAAKKETEPNVTVDKAISAIGISIAYEVRGKGEPALIFVHGWGGNRKDWFKQVEYFSPHYRVVTIDLPGFGESGNTRGNWTIQNFGKDVVSVIKKIDEKKIVIIGFSMGGPVALEATQLIPDRVMGVVPVDIIADVETTLSQEMLDRNVAYFMDLAFNPTFEKIKNSPMFSKKADSVMISRAIEVFESSEKTGWEASIREVFRYMYASSDLKESLEAVKAPICCINSANNKTNLKTAQKYNRNISAKTIEDAGHIVFWEAPDEFNRLLEGTIQEFVQMKSTK